MKTAPPKPVKTDKKAPKTITIEVWSRSGKTAQPWGNLFGGLRVFTTGGAGYNVSGKVVNPASGETYNFSGNLVLVGSTPKKEKLRKKPDFPMGVVFTSFRRGDAEAVKKQLMKEYAVTAEIVTAETGGFSVKCTRGVKK